MFRGVGQVVPKAQEESGTLTTLYIPFKGLNTRAPLSVMGPEYAISMKNVLPESYGLRTRKGYTEYATNIGVGSLPVSSILSYYPAIAAPTLFGAVQQIGVFQQMFSSYASRAGTPPGKLFAAKENKLWDVTSGGVGPWIAETGVSGVGDYWNGVNMQNVAGAHLCICNENGGYAIHSGTGWSMPVQGTAPGQIAGVDPAKLCYVTLFKKRLWFVQFDSTKAWYLPVDQITGAATEFDFGSQFKHGGKLVSIVNWTIEGGDGLNDLLVAVSSQGDVVIYQGQDPDTAATFQIKGTWYCGPLPVGRRQVRSSGSDVFILSQFGLVPISRLLTQTSMSADMQQHISYLVDPLIARLMRDYSEFQGWQIIDLAKEELIAVGIPKEVATFGGTFLVYKVTTQGWALISDTKYASLINIGQLIYSGTTDGRVVRAFDGPLDNVLLAPANPFSSAFSPAFGGSTTGSSGLTIPCQVTPAYQPLGKPGHSKRFLMVRPSFTCKVAPQLRIQILTDYGSPPAPLTPTLPADTQSKWGAALWNSGVWAGQLLPIRDWLGCAGEGFSATVQLDYATGGDTLLTAIDFWTEEGGVM